MADCSNCGTPFEITNSDLEFYVKVSPLFNGKKYPVPPPTKCADCRFQRRLNWRNERTLHHRKCDLTGVDIITIYTPESDYKVYSAEAWWSDKWDAIEYGRDFDLEKTFVENFKELMHEVPLIRAIGPGNNENSPYANYAGLNKNCHLVFNSSDNEDCYFTRGLRYSTDTLDAYYSTYCTLCYEIINCHHCFNLRLSINCDNCQDSAFLFNCTGCKYCVGCVNLKNKEYFLFNKPSSKQEIEEYLRNLKNMKNIRDLAERFEDLKLKYPHRPHQNFQSENAMGNYISESKNTYDCLECIEVEDCKHTAFVHKLKSSSDATGFGRDSELLYETVGCGFSHNLISCFDTGPAHNCYYCISCKSCHDCFGCISLRHKEYCILNKQYSKEEYENLVPKIIEHMIKDNEYGEFFSNSLSPFPYNETIAPEFFPLSKEEAISQGFKWRDRIDPIPDVEKIIPAERLPDLIDDIPDDVLNWAITCEETSRPFQIMKRELSFYRKQGIPIPHFHPDERHRRRVLKRNPKKMWERTCDKCGEGILTTYSPQRPEIVHCETCYLNEVY